MKEYTPMEDLNYAWFLFKQEHEGYISDLNRNLSSEANSLVCGLKLEDHTIEEVLITEVSVWIHWVAQKLLDEGYSEKSATKVLENAIPKLYGKIFRKSWDAWSDEFLRLALAGIFKSRETIPVEDEGGFLEAMFLLDISACDMAFHAQGPTDVVFKKVTTELPLEELFLQEEWRPKKKLSERVLFLLQVSEKLEQAINVIGECSIETIENFLIGLELDSNRDLDKLKTFWLVTGPICDVNFWARVPDFRNYFASKNHNSSARATVFEILRLINSGTFLENPKMSTTPYLVGCLNIFKRLYGENPLSKDSINTLFLDIPEKEDLVVKINSTTRMAISGCIIRNLEKTAKKYNVPAEWLISSTGSLLEEIYNDKDYVKNSLLSLDFLEQKVSPEYFLKNIDRKAATK